MCQSSVFNIGFQQLFPKLKLSLFCTFDISLRLFMLLVACFSTQPVPTLCSPHSALNPASETGSPVLLLLELHAIWTVTSCLQQRMEGLTNGSQRLQGAMMGIIPWTGEDLSWETGAGSGQSLAVGQGGLTSAARLAWVQIRAQHHEPASLASSLSLGKKAVWEHLTHPRARAVMSL